MAKPKTAKTGPAAETNGHSADQFQMTYLSLLVPSETNPRKRFDDKTVAELAESLKAKGMIEPMIIRAKGKLYEIVCGERRFRAATAAGMKEVPTIVRQLTDEQVLDIQIHENLHREDVHPMDEAYGYKFLQDKLKCTIAELAVRVGKTEKYVLNRLKLNDLIPAAQKDIEDGVLPLIYALEIGKYGPETQELILEKAAYHQRQDYNSRKGQWEYSAERTKLNRFSDMQSWINENILLRLSSAPFDRKATNLRKDGLACVACPDRSGANQTLFDDGLTGKKDACLNPVCWKGKKETLVQITRQELADAGSVKISTIPIVNTDRWQTSDGVIGTDDFMIIGDKPDKEYYRQVSAKKCKKLVKAVDISQKRFGKVYDICPASSRCGIHHQSSGSSSAKSAKTDEAAREEELIKKRKRREEIWDSTIAELVRKKVLVKAAAAFAPDLEFRHQFSNVLKETVSRFWGVHSITGYVESLCKDAGIKNPRHAAEELELAQILFFFLHGSKGEIGSGNYWRSQKEIKTLANIYEVNYRLLDAQERLVNSSKKAFQVHRTYLDAVEAGDESVKIPRQFTDKYKTQD